MQLGLRQVTEGLETTVTQAVDRAVSTAVETAVQTTVTVAVDRAVSTAVETVIQTTVTEVVNTAIDPIEQLLRSLQNTRHCSFEKPKVRTDTSLSS